MGIDKVVDKIGAEKIGADKDGSRQSGMIP